MTCKVLPNARASNAIALLCSLQLYRNTGTTGTPVHRSSLRQINQLPQFSFSASLKLALTRGVLQEGSISASNLAQRGGRNVKGIAKETISAKAGTSKAARLRALIVSKETTFLMEAHNALSAKIAQESGFEGLWASGLSISASLGLSDRNEASWTQVLEVTEFMSDNTDVPILMDGDTGFGNFNNVRRLVKKLSQRGIGGVCLEDKLFPKINSFVGEAQELAPIEDFCGKLRAAKDSQLDPEFCVVARIEALVSGLGMEEALRRADRYHAAGADAILIHSKRSEADEILEFCRLWEARCPVVIVPTKYYKTPTIAFKQAGVSTVIWANHSLRSAISAIRKTTVAIKQHESVSGIEHDIAPLNDVFRLTNEFEVQEAEKKYLTLDPPASLPPAERAKPQ